MASETASASQRSTGTGPATKVHRPIAIPTAQRWANFFLAIPMNMASTRTDRSSRMQPPGPGISLLPKMCPAAATWVGTALTLSSGNYSRTYRRSGSFCRRPRKAMLRIAKSLPPRWSADNVWGSPWCRCRINPLRVLRLKTRLQTTSPTRRIRPGWAVLWARTSAAPILAMRTCQRARRVGRAGCFEHSASRNKTCAKTPSVRRASIGCFVAGANTGPCSRWKKRCSPLPRGKRSVESTSFASVQTSRANLNLYKAHGR